MDEVLVVFISWTEKEMKNSCTAYKIKSSLLFHFSFTSHFKCYLEHAGVTISHSSLRSIVMQGDAPSIESWKNRSLSKTSSVSSAPGLQ